MFRSATPFWQTYNYSYESLKSIVFSVKSDAWDPTDYFWGTKVTMRSKVCLLSWISALPWNTVGFLTRRSWGAACLAVHQKVRSWRKVRERNFRLYFFSLHAVSASPGYILANTSLQDVVLPWNRQKHFSHSLYPVHRHCWWFTNEVGGKRKEERKEKKKMWQSALALLPMSNKGRYG